MSLELAGTGAAGYSTIISANAPGTSGAARGLWRHDAEGQIEASFDVTAGIQDIAPLVTAFGHSIEGLDAFAGDTAPLSLKATVGLEESQKDDSASPGDAGSQQAACGYVLRFGESQLAGSGFSGELVHRRPEGERPQTEGTLALSHLSLPVLAGLGFGSSGSLSELRFRQPRKAGHGVR